MTHFKIVLSETDTTKYRHLKTVSLISIFTLRDQFNTIFAKLDSNHLLTEMEMGKLQHKISAKNNMLLDSGAGSKTFLDVLTGFFYSR